MPKVFTDELICKRALLEAVESEIKHLEGERDAAIKCQWFDKVSKLECQKQGVEIVRRLVNLVDLDRSGARAQNDLLTSSPT